MPAGDLIRVAATSKHLTQAVRFGLHPLGVLGLLLEAKRRGLVEGIRHLLRR
jgi:predicted nucleic acid-binding protein